MHRTSMYISIFLGGQVSPTSISSPGTNGLRTVAQGKGGAGPLFLPYCVFDAWTSNASCVLNRGR